jgi:hypothetical protein
MALSPVVAVRVLPVPPVMVLVVAAWTVLPPVVALMALSPVVAVRVLPVPPVMVLVVAAWTVLPPVVADIVLLV